MTESSGSDGKPRVFLREATGLVRESSAKSSFVAQWLLVVGGIPIFLLTYLASYPGANFFLGFLIGVIPMIALFAVYSLFGISMPRSGGDYVYVSRGLNSFIGFISSTGFAAGYMVSNGIFTVLGAYYVSYQFTTLGLVDHNPTFLSWGSLIVTPSYAFTLAAIILVISFLVAILRPRFAWATVFWGGTVAIACSIIMFIILATINISTFTSTYNNFITSNNASLAGNGFTNATTYQQTIVAGGWTPPTSVIAATLAIFPTAIFSYAWTNLPANWAGEMKQVRKTLPLIIMGGLVFITVYYILLFQLSINAFGQPFLTSWSSLSFKSSYPLPYSLSDYIPFFAYLVYHNPIVPWIMFLGFFVPVIFEVPPLLIASVRYIFAWSFDRLLPARLASVDQRTHTPIIATVIAFIVNIAGAASQAFYPSATPAVLVPLYVFGYLFPALAAIAFPYLKKRLYESSFVVKRKIGGVPAITWLGLVAFIGLAIGTYSLFASGTLVFQLPDYMFYALAYGSGVVVFLAAYFVRKRSGISLSAAFSEIPPE